MPRLPPSSCSWHWWRSRQYTCMAELTAVGIYMNFWYPDLPQWLSALVALCIMTVVNFIAVSAYGEFEFWFALVKICTIIFMIISGIGMIVFGIGNGGIATGIANLWQNGGFFPNGFSGTPNLSKISFKFTDKEPFFADLSVSKTHFTDKPTFSSDLSVNFWPLC